MDKLGKYTVDETDAGTLLIKGDITKEVNAPDGDPLTINGAWYINQLPNNIVMECTDGTLAMFHLTPFRGIKDTDLRPYKGHHPRKCKGQLLPDYLYRFYGLSRSDETLSEVIRVRVSPSEKEKLEAIANNNDKTVSEFLREYIRCL